MSGRRNAAPVVYHVRRRPVAGDSHRIRGFQRRASPVGVTDVVWIYRKESMATLGRVCQVKLRALGLRGMVIGWTDGLFDGRGYVYYGNVVQR